MFATFDTPEDAEAFLMAPQPRLANGDTLFRKSQLDFYRSRGYFRREIREMEQAKNPAGT